MRIYLLRRTFARMLAALLAVSLGPATPPLAPAALAAPEPVPATPSASASVDPTLQIVVFEAPGCLHCNLFRRYVLPAYSASPRSREIPLRFLDLNEVDADQLGLDTAIDLVPTAVLLQNNREVGRIPGYVGPENFFHAVSHLLARVE